VLGRSLRISLLSFGCAVVAWVVLSAVYAGSGVDMKILVPVYATIGVLVAIIVNWLYERRKGQRS
jgi:hypothetical protein